MRSSWILGTASFAVLMIGQNRAVAQPAAFTFQGQLKQAGVPVNQACDFEFSLWTAEAGGMLVGTSLDELGLNVMNGLFQATLDFGDAAFDGSPRWLQVRVRCPAWDQQAPEPPFTTLAPRSFLAAAPYAVRALHGGATGSLTLAVDAIFNGAKETAFAIKQTGTGSAGSFSIDNPITSWSALFATSNGLWPALHATQSGGHSVAQFENTLLNNPIPTFVAITNGTGAAIQGTTRPGVDGSGVLGHAEGNGNGVEGSVNGSGNAIQGTVTNNVGRAAYFQSTSAANTKGAVLIESSGTTASKALRVDSTGAGDAGYFEIQNSASDGEALEARTNGTGNGVGVLHTGRLGRAGYFLHQGSLNPSPAVEVLTTGLGTGAHVEIDNVDSDSPAVFAKTDGNGAAVQAQTFGLGPAAYLTVNNANSTNNALFVSTIGPGRAALIQANHTESTLPAVQISTAGRGPALDVSGKTNLHGDVEVDLNVIMGYQIVECTFQNVAFADCSCPAGKRVIGGGCRNSTPFGGPLEMSFPNGATAWTCFYDGTQGILTVSVICANIR